MTSDVLNQLESIDAQLDALLDAGQMDEYARTLELRDQVVGEIDSDDRRGAKALADADEREQAKAVKGSAQEQVQILKGNLALAQAQRDELGTAPRKTAAGQFTAEGAERVRLVGEIAELEREIEVLEGRLPYVDLDDETVEDTRLTLQSEVELGRKELKEVGDLAGMSGTRTLLERKIAKADAKHRELATESEFRKRERMSAVLLNDRATKRALGARAQGLEAWKAQRKQAQAGAETGSPTALQSALDASKAIAAIESMPETPSAEELGPHLEAVKAGMPHNPGTWR